MHIGAHFLTGKFRNPLCQYWAPRFRWRFLRRGVLPGGSSVGFWFAGGLSFDGPVFFIGVPSLCAGFWHWRGMFFSTTSLHLSFLSHICVRGIWLVFMVLYMRFLGRALTWERQIGTNENEFGFLQFFWPRLCIFLIVGNFVANSSVAHDLRHVSNL
jgi:hypothetical protein